MTTVEKVKDYYTNNLNSSSDLKTNACCTLAKYPKNIKKDLNILKKLKVNYVYLPKFADIYSFKPKKKIFVDKFVKKLCGKYRPGHFEAVVDVVNNFIKIIKPKMIFLGEKDMQQLVIIKRFFKNKYKNLKVIRCKTIREKKGLALSSRNFNLTKKQRIIGSNIYSFILKNKIALNNSKKVNFQSIKKKIIEIGATKIDYVELLNIEKLMDSNSKRKEYRFFIAYYLGKIRLIDNV